MPRFAPASRPQAGHRRRRLSGIGEATAIDLALASLPVALGARRVEKLEDLVSKIRADGGEAVGFHLDVTNPVQ